MDRPFYRKNSKTVPMKKITFLSALCLFIFVNLHAQKISREFGQVSKEDFEIMDFQGDESVEAIVLYDIGTSRFVRDNNRFNVVFERRTKIKILKPSGVENSEIEIPFYQQGNIYEKVRDIEGYTYNFEDGNLTRTSLDENNIYEEIKNESWLNKKFAMPDVKAGSIIEFRYEIHSPYIFNLRDWYFQRQIPTLYSEYVVRTIPFYEYAYILQGANNLHTNSAIPAGGLPRSISGVEYGEMINTFVMLNVPAFKDETFITSIQDYIIKIDFQLAKTTNLYGVSEEIITTWPELCEELLSDGEFAKFLKSTTKKVKKLTNLESYASLSDVEKLKKAVDYVKENYRWNERNDKFPQKSFNEFTSEKVGNNANINLFLTGLLQEVGMEAKPVLLSTRDHGKVNRQYPFHHFLNYVITMVKVDDAYVLVDGTDMQCPYNRIPFRCINGQGLIVQEGEEQWVELTSNRISVIEENMNLSFTDDNEKLTGDFVVISTDYDALEMRKTYEDNHLKLEEELNDNGLELLDSITTRNYSDQEKPYLLTFRAECPMEKIGNKIFVSPFLNAPIAENPLKEDSRSYPIDMKYIKSRRYNTQLKVPEGYQVQELPENFSMDNKWMTINFVVNDKSTSDGKIQVTGQYVLKKAVYAANDYSNLKYMYNEMIKKFNEKIIFTTVEENKNIGMK